MKMADLECDDVSFHITVLVSFKTKSDMESHIAVLKRSTSKKNVGWSSKHWNPKASWQRPVTEDAG